MARTIKQQVIKKLKGEYKDGRGRISLDLSSQLLIAFKKDCKQNKVKMASVVQELIKHYLDI